jgi:hypothetical protein
MKRDYLQERRRALQEELNDWQKMPKLFKIFCFGIYLTRKWILEREILAIDMLVERRKQINDLAIIKQIEWERQKRK